MKEITSDVDRIRITKANKLIEISLLESATRLSLRDQKVILSVIGQISPDDEEFKKYYVSIEQLEKLSGIDRNNLYRDIDAICTRLMTSVISIKEPENEDGFLKVTWFSHARYSPKKSHVEFSVSPELKPYLLKLKNNFTTYHLRQVVNLNSMYAIRLYELLRQFYPLKKARSGVTRAFRELELEELRAYLGVPKGRYQKFAEFRRNVIDKCSIELEEKTDIVFDYESVRKGRKVSSLNFHIRHNEKPEAIESSVIEGEHQAAGMAPEETVLDDFLINGIRNLIPEIADFELALIGRTYSKELISESVMDLFNAQISGGDSH